MSSLFNYSLKSDIMKFIYFLLVAAFLSLLMAMFLSMAVTVPSSNITTSENLTALSPEFTEGWEDGHCEGWKDVKGQYAYCPYPPYPPYPPYGKDTYRGGYNMGFKAGRRAAFKNYL